ncbi:zinc ribbon domain-containing protein [Vulcanococcus sp.]|uniref:zinc ribbon domain-containing protein n=1 Tax=Vulcanococcus sp. TaxID=2856995 RepID=UPI003F6958D5
MQRPIPWLWITVIGVLLLAPGFTARLFVDVLEGVTLLLVFGPLVLAGAGFLAWQWFKRRLVICPACGTPSIGASVCPACGGALAGPSSSSGRSVDQPARDAVIDVQVSEVSDDR